MANFKLKCFAYNLIVFVLAISLSGVTAFCAELRENGEKGQTTVYAEIPPKFVVTIPEDKYINYKANSTNIGEVAIHEKRLEQNSFVEVSLDNPEVLTNTSNNSYTIPFTLNKISDNSKFTGCRFYNGKDTEDAYPLKIDITDDSWNKAKNGNYNVRLVFNIEYKANQ